MRIGDTESYKIEYIQNGKKIVKRGLEPDCEHCCMGWEDRGYEGECNDCGCYMAKRGNDYPKTMLICMLPRWIKKIFLKKVGVNKHE